MPFSALQVLRNQWTSLPTPSSLGYDLTGRIALVTGSNVGVGLETARHFASLGAKKVILGVRTVEKGDKAREEILDGLRKAGKDKLPEVEVWELNMASFESVKAFAKRAEKELDRLDVAVLNAGSVTDRWTTTKDGYETMLQVNAVAAGLLAVLLFPLLERTSALPPPDPQARSLRPHLVLVSSDAHHMASTTPLLQDHPIHALNEQKGFDGFSRYNASKLLQVMIARELGKTARGVLVNSSCPGFCSSNLFRDLIWPKRVVLALFAWTLARTPEVGSRSIVWSALADTEQGALVDACAVAEPADFILSDEGKEAQKRVWSDLEEIYRRQEPSVSSVLDR